jgi:predicted nucleic acid-binding protein
VVAVDTAPFIYFIEENPAYLGTIHPFFEALDADEFRAVTSMVTLIEVLVHPLRQGNEALAHEYRNILLEARGLDLRPVSRAIAEEAASLRAAHGLRTPDAIQIATAIHEGSTSLLTNDSRLPSLPNLNVLVLDDLRKHA